MSKLEKRVKEIELDNTYSDRSVESFEVAGLIAALRKCREQRDMWRNRGEQEKYDAELLKILEGK